MEEGPSRPPIAMDRHDCPQKFEEDWKEPEDGATKETPGVAHIPVNGEPAAFAESIGPTDSFGISTGTNLNCQGRRKNSFPCQLYRILANPEYASIVTWMPHGRSWKVLRPSEFTRLVAPRYYSHAKFSSFIRQANGWGFRRVTQGFDVGSYYHEMFLRGMPHLLNSMNRVKLEGGRMMRANPEKEPDFYSMSWMPPVPGGPKGQAQPQPQRLAASVSSKLAANEVQGKDEEDDDASSSGSSPATPSPSPPNDPPSEKKRPREQASFSDGNQRCDAASLAAPLAGCNVQVSLSGPGAGMAGTTMPPPPSSAAPPMTFFQGRRGREYAGNSYGSRSQGCGGYGGYSGAQQGQEHCPAPNPSPAAATPASSAAPVCCLNYSSSPDSHQQQGGQLWMPMSRVQPQPHWPPQVSPINGQPTQAQTHHPQHRAFPPPPPLAGPFVDQTSSFVRQCTQPFIRRPQQEMQWEGQQRKKREAQQMAPQVEEEDSPSYNPKEGCDNRQQQKQQGRGQSKKQQDAQSVEECQCLQVMEHVQHTMISNANCIVEAFSSAFSNALLRELKNFQGKLTEMLAQQRDAMLQQEKRAQQEQDQQQGQTQAPQCRGQGPPQVPFLQQGQQVPQQQQKDTTRAPSAVVVTGHQPPSVLAMPPSRQMMMPTHMPLANSAAKAEGRMDDPSAWDDIFDSENDRLEDDKDHMLQEEEDGSSVPPEVCQPFPKKRKVNFWFSDDNPVASTEQGPIELC